MSLAINGKVTSDVLAHIAFSKIKKIIPIQMSACTLYILNAAVAVDVMCVIEREREWKKNCEKLSDIYIRGIDANVMIRKDWK